MNAAISEITKQSDARFAPPAIAAHPVWILTINNGAGHSKAAEALAKAWRKINDKIPAQVVEISDFMSPLARFTHVTAYLWLVKNLPSVWNKIDDYQKRQTQTSPEWFYRRECRKLFDSARRIQPSAIVATEVGCCEVAALVKRDLNLKIPLVAVNINYDADRAWIQPEIDLYALVSEKFAAEFEQNGAPTEKIKVWGAPLADEFNNTENTRTEICERLDFDENKKIILLSGGGEGLGLIEKSLEGLLRLADQTLQFIVLTGRNGHLRNRCERVVARDNAAGRVRVFGWIDDVPQLMRACDLLVSKLGNAFDEAIASEIPIVALEPPPGSERAQYELLEIWGTGRAVRTIDELTETVQRLINDDAEREKIRKCCRKYRRSDAARRIANWLSEQLGAAAENGNSNFLQKEAGKI